MLIIFGSKTRRKVTGRAYVRCPVDGELTVYARVATKRWFTLFFIPIFPYTTAGEYAECVQCGTTVAADFIDWSDAAPDPAHLVAA